MRRWQSAVGVALTVLLLLAGCDPSEPVEVWLGEQRLQVVVANDDGERARGLQGYESILPDQGMLFVWDEAAPRTFEMKTVSVPIEVVFIGPDKRVSAIHPLAPGDTTPADSPTPARWVVEVAAGWTARHGVAPGSRFVPPGGRR